MGKTNDLEEKDASIMTFEVGGQWIAVRIEQMDRIAQTPTVWPVPLAEPGHFGLLDTGESLVPVLSLTDGPTLSELAALLHVRGETVAVAIDRPGRVFGHYRLMNEPDSECLPGILAQRGRVDDVEFWLIDPDQLWLNPAGEPAAPVESNL